MKKVLLPIMFFVALWGGLAFAQNPGPCDPSSPNFQDCFIESQDISTTGTLGGREFLELLQNIGGFLMITGSLIAGIVIIVAGFVWMASGSNPTRVATAKGILKNGVIGALILFASGVIINTVVLFAGSWQSFFR